MRKYICFTLLLSICFQGCRTVGDSSTKSISQGGTIDGIAGVNTYLYEVRNVSNDKSAADFWIFRSQCEPGQPIIRDNCQKRPLVIQRDGIYARWEADDKSKPEITELEMLSTLRAEQSRLAGKIKVLETSATGAEVTAFLRARHRQVTSLIERFIEEQRRKVEVVSPSDTREIDSTRVTLIKFLLENEEILPMLTRIEGEVPDFAETSGEDAQKALLDLDQYFSQLEAYFDRYGIPYEVLGSSIPYHISYADALFWVYLGEASDNLRAMQECNHFGKLYNLSMSLPTLDEMNAHYKVLERTTVGSAEDRRWTSMRSWFAFIRRQPTPLEPRVVWIRDQVLGVGGKFDIANGRQFDEFNAQSSVICVRNGGNVTIPAFQ